MHPITNEPIANDYFGNSYLIWSLIFAFLLGCNRQEPQVASSPTTAKLDSRETIPVNISQKQDSDEEFGMELIDLVANPELDQGIPRADTPLYLWDAENPSRFPFQVASAMDKIGVNVTIFEDYPELYAAVPVLVDQSFMDQRVEFVESLGYAFRCHPIHWNIDVDRVLERQDDYLVEACPIVTEYCDVVPLATKGCIEKWSFPKNSLNTPRLVSRTKIPGPGEPGFPYGIFP
ncbi:MAG: hypothetical protein FJ308_19120 [Planctomycetes bacterium]|nr:hypothetical protein [Planctomycetota bacterium]